MPRLALVVALALALAACSSPAAESGQVENAHQRTYVSLGDSYATGYGSEGASASFAQIVAERSDLRLVNLACNGATSADLLAQPVCGPEVGSRTQVDATVDASRTGNVDLVTVVIGSNDLLEPCAVAETPAECARLGAKYVDVTGTTGGYRTLTDDPRYGQIPASVAEVCTFTYYCDHGDVHPTPAGHQAIADAVIAASR